MILRVCMSIGLAVLVAACADTKSAPLIFVSSNVVGIDITAGTAQSATPGMTVGYKSFDAAIVPTQRATSEGLPVTGCYASAESSSISAPCAPEAPSNVASTSSGDSAAGPTGVPGSTPKAGGNSQTTSAIRSRHGDGGGYEPADQDMSPSEYSSDIHFLHAVFVPAVSKPKIQGVPADGVTAAQGVNGAVAPANGAAGQDANGTAPGNGTAGQGANGATAPANANGSVGSQNPVTSSVSHQNIRDALSVFSSFSTKTDATVGTSGGASINLGKLFATGVSAQILTEGVNYHLQYSGLVQCIQALTAAKQANVSDDKLPSCN